MKAVNDYRILMPNIPYYDTGLQFNQFDVVYYTGISAGSYVGPGGTPTETISTGPFQTGYYYATGRLNSGFNYFYMRPDSIVSGPSGPNVWTQNYFFVPCYGSTINFKASYYQNNFQDYYQVIVGKSENILQCEASLQFKGISDNEAKALNHFYQNSFVQDPMSNGQGHEPINMYLFPPHTKLRPFYLKSINNNFENINFNNVTLNVESPFISSTSWKEKLIPFTSAQTYNSNRTYSKHDYILITDSTTSTNGFYYFSGDNPAKNVYPPTAPWTDVFYFAPDLVQQLDFDSSLYKNDLGGFYLYQDLGLNPNFFVFDLTFNNRSDKEAKAILHFLENHNGLQVFDYSMHTYFTGSRNFFCPEWSHTYNFLDNNSISAKFIEFKFSLEKTMTFNTELKPTGFDFGFLPQGFSTERQYQIGNNTRRYPVLYNLGNKIEVPPYESDFFNYDLNNGRFLTVEAGKTGEFNIIYSIPENVNTSANQDLRGYFQITQENENLGLFGPDLKLYYTGIRRNAGTAAPYNFLSGVQNCVASPYYDQTTNSVGLKVRWTLPGSGYYFTSFLGKLATNSGFASATTKTVSVPLNNTTYLYDIGTPNETLYYTTFPNLALNTPYYVGIEGLNSTYTSHSSQIVYASGVGDSDAWRNPNLEYLAVNSGLTTNVLSVLGINPPSITISKEIKKLQINNAQYEYLDLYDYIVKNFPFGSAFGFYSGLTIDFINTNIGPKNSNSNYGIYDSGSFLITGDYSAMVSGVTINFYNNSFVYGKGGSVAKTNSDSIKQGKNAFYIKCSGIININIDQTSVIAGGGGAGENIEIGDLVNTNANKFTTLKDSLKFSNNYDGKTYLDYNITYDKKFSDDTFTDFNKTENVTILNKNYCTTNGAGILYDFFNTGLSNPPLVYGGAGAPYGKGTGTILAGVNLSVQNADLNTPSTSFDLRQIVTLQKEIFQ